MYCSVLYSLPSVVLSIVCKVSSTVCSILYFFSPTIYSLLYFLSSMTASSTVCSVLHFFSPIVCSTLYFLSPILCLIFCTFFWFFSEFISIFNEKRENMLTNACKVLAKHWLSSHHPTFGLTYIINYNTIFFFFYKYYYG